MKLSYLAKNVVLSLKHPISQSISLSGRTDAAISIFWLRQLQKQTIQWTGITNSVALKMLCGAFRAMFASYQAQLGKLLILFPSKPNYSFKRTADVGLRYDSTSAAAAA